MMDYLKIGAAIAVLVVLGIILGTTERPPMGSIQHGYRGTAMDYLYNPRDMAVKVADNKVPTSLPYMGNVGPKASTVYKNVKVLGDLSVGEFTRLMASMTTWVEPTAGCAGCHNVANMADDSSYQKVVARRMIQMVRHINADWTAHVQQTGVTCYTCHRGQPVPANIWFNNPGPTQAGGFAEIPAGKNHPTPLIVAGGSSLPLDAFTPFLEQSNEIRISSTTALPSGDRASIKQTDWTYSLMMHFSQALGVNCTYCHNTRSFSNWEQSSPQRATAWYGIRMVRDLNNAYLDPLHDTFPPTRWGAALSDSPKVNCATCHNGVYKPLFGVSMAKDFPELKATPVAQSQPQKQAQQ
jgi:photosynthetic reaction center cytochrome c subunit